MQRPVERRHVGVRAIHGQPVLRQVVRADREEVRLGRQAVGEQRRRGHLDHDAELRNARQTAARRGLLEQAPGGLQLRERRDHRQQDAELPLAGRLAERRELLEEELGVREAVAQAPQAERGVVARRRPDALLSAEVVGPDHHGVRGRGLEQRLVGRALLLDSGRTRKRPQVEELGTEEADAFRAVALESRDLLGKLEVRADGDPHAVPGDGGLRGAAAEPTHPLAFLADPLQAPADADLSRDRARRCRDLRPRRSALSGDTFSQRFGIPTTAGSPKERAMIEACEVGPPRSSARPRTRRGSRRAASTGESSSATRIEPRGTSDGRGRSPPARCAPISPRDVGEVGLALAHGGGVGGGEPSLRARARPRPAPTRRSRAPCGCARRSPRGTSRPRRSGHGPRESRRAPRSCRPWPRGSAGEVLGRLPRRPAQSALLPLEFLRVDRPPERRQTAEADDDRPANGYARRNGEALQHGALNA